MTGKTILAVGIIGLFMPSHAQAWGDEGHRVVALIAESRLTPAARQHVQHLLGGTDVREAMSNASVWADQIKWKRPETRPWHYVDIERGSGGYDRRRDCPNDDCVVEQIERETATLAQPGVSAPIKSEALKFLIHFMGDLHQPLHCADNHDRGGNEVRVLLGKKRTNLHAVWDSGVVKELGRKPSRVAEQLETEITFEHAKEWQRGTFEKWANETFGIGQSSVYAAALSHGPTDAPVILPSDYAATQSGIVKTQLEKAGVRLAGLLNAMFPERV